MIKKIILVLLLLVSLVSCVESSNKTTNYELNKAEFTGLEFDDQVTYCIGHQTPDTDTVMSAIAMADFLNCIGIKAEARITGSVNNETAYLLEEFNIDEPAVLEDAAGTQLWLVDHSSTAQMVNGYADAKIIGITDHHGIGDYANSNLIYVDSTNAVSTTCKIYKYYTDCGIELTEKQATVLFLGLISDSNNLKTTHSPEYDKMIYNELQALCPSFDATTVYYNMVEAKLNRIGKTDTEIFYADYKNYNTAPYTYGIGCVKVWEVKDIPAMATRILAAMKEEIKTVDKDFLLCNIYDFDYATGYVVWVAKDEVKFKAILDAAFPSATQEPNIYICVPSLNRKTQLAPSVDQAIADSLE